jgi:mRNA-degrading endonuclease RelE of RelBE toxin-antitoxin system
VPDSAADLPALWRVVIPSQAIRQVADLPEAVRLEVKDILADLAENPEPEFARRLRKNRDIWRIRFYEVQHPTSGRPIPLYRLIYRTYPASRKIVLLRIARRDDETYSGLDRW